MDNIKIRIFLSSTFNDSMIRTRDAFRNEMLAKLNAVAGQIQGNVYLSDFELGIPEGTNAIAVICTCLDTIIMSDYFVGIMGEERGTLLSEYLVGMEWEGSRYASLISRAIEYEFTVLELEFLCAVMCGIKSFFYLSADHRSSTDVMSIEKFLFMHNQNITGFTSVEVLKQDIIQRMEAEWNLRYYHFSQYSQQEKDINIIMANKLRYYVPNSDCIQAINNYVNSDSTQVLFITGKGGSGKSTMLFDWFNSHLEDSDYHVLCFAFEHISFSLDELLEQILYDIELIENNDFISGYHDMVTDLKRIEYFKTVLNGLVQPYVLLIDGLEHVSSHMGIRVRACLPDELRSNVKIITTWNEDINSDTDGIFWPIGKFDVESFVETFFEREGKRLIYQQYKKQLAVLVQGEWRPDEIRLMLSYVILSAKYNNIDAILSEFKSECMQYGNPYCSYLILLNKYFTFDGDEPLKEALLLLYHSQNGIPLSVLQSAVPSGDRLKEIFYVIYFLLQKNTYNRFLLGNEYVREALEALYPDRLEEYEIRFFDLNYLELLSKEGQMMESYDIWEEHLGYLIRSRKVIELEQIFTTYIGQIADLWYYNRELLMKAFDLIRSPALIMKLKEQATEDRNSNAPFFISHLFYEYGYYKEAIDIYECFLSGSRRTELPESDLATVLNNFGLNLCHYGETKAGEKYLLQAYQIRKKYFAKDQSAFFESCDNLSEFYLENGDPKNASKYLDEVIEICEVCSWSNNPEQMKCYISRAIAEEASSPSNAFAYYDRALKISDAVFGSESLQSARILQMKGVLYLETREGGGYGFKMWVRSC